MPHVRLARDLVVATLASIGSKLLTDASAIVVLAVGIFAFTVLKTWPPLVRAYLHLAGDSRRAVEWIAVGSLLLALVGVVRGSVGPRFSVTLISDDEVRRLVHAHRWISYEPTDYHPLANPEPEIARMEREVASIRRAGFDGIVTFTSRPPFDELPTLADRLGMRIIVGVWDPADRTELHLAARRPADGYVVGHNGLHTDYTWQELREAVEELRFRTRRPVTTTERLAAYLYDERLIRLGDWVFPDAHLSLNDAPSVAADSFSADPLRDSELIAGYAREIAKAARPHHRPVLLKMVGYPVDGVPGASRESQARFFDLLLEARREVHPSLPEDVAISVHSAFDTRWKKDTWPFFPWETHTGILEPDGTMRPGAHSLARRLP